MRLSTRGPVAAYAAVLDGRHLWLAIHAQSGELALKDADTGDVHPLTGELPDSDPAYTAVRADLTQLPPPTRSDGTATYDVVVKSTRLLPAKPVWSPPLPDPAPARTPRGPDPTTQLELQRTEDGHLRLHRRPLPATAELDAIDQRGDRVHLRIRPVDGVQPGCRLLLLDTEDAVLGSLPVTAQDGFLETLVGVDDLAAGYVGMIRFAVGTEQSWVRVSRRDNGLSDPNHAVLLPELFDPETGDLDRPRARFRWTPDSLLVARSLDPEEQAT